MGLPVSLFIPVKLCLFSVVGYWTQLGNFKKKILVPGFSFRDSDLSGPEHPDVAISGVKL